MTAPLVPRHVNLRGFRYMPLDVVRLRDSDFAAHAGGEGFRCAVLLWCAAWHQQPAGSLPDDDKVLASLVGMGRSPREWRKVRGETLRNWIKCDDGRLYHPVVAEKALEAWEEHLKSRFRNELGRLKKAGERAKIKPDYPTFDEWRARYERTGDPAWPLQAVPGTDGECPGDVPGESVSKGREGKGRDNSVLHIPTRADRSPGAEHLARALREMGWQDCSGEHPDLIAAAAAGVTEAGIRDAAAGKADKSIRYISIRAINRLSDARPQPGTGAPPGAPQPSKPTTPEEALIRALREQRDRIEGNTILSQAERERQIAAVDAELTRLGAAEEALS